MQKVQEKEEEETPGQERRPESKKLPECTAAQSGVPAFLEDLDYEGLEQGQFEAFCRLVAVLRGERGCPWDRAQTLESLKPCMIDELTEAVAGISLSRENSLSENLCEELGDLLMLVVLLAQIAKEKGMFDIRDVVRGIGRKMLRRHPHVFGEEARRGWNPELLSPQELLPTGWKEIKQREKRGSTQAEQKRQQEAYQAALHEIIEQEIEKLAP